MRKKEKTRRFSVMYALAVCACLCFCSCGGGDDKNDVSTPPSTPSAPSADTGYDNTEDLIVTGGVGNVGSSSAAVVGYLNVDQTSVMLIESFGIEYFTSSQPEPLVVLSNKYENREFGFILNNLQPNTTYYYRAFAKQLSGLTQYGKVLSFTTTKVKIDVKETSYTWARIQPDEFFAEYELYYSTKKDQDFIKYEYYDDDKQEMTSTMQYYIATIEGLTPGTTYYFYLENSQQKSDVFSFTTKALPFDLSGVSVTCKYTPAIDSYKDEKGETHDLKWLGGTFTMSITSNLGNQVNYGVKSDIKRFIYSKSTSSPYTIEVGAYAYATNIAQIEALAERTNNGDATSDDYDTLRALLRECALFPLSLYLSLQAFIEYNGEQIYVGKIFGSSDFGLLTP